MLHGKSVLLTYIVAVIVLVFSSISSADEKLWRCSTGGSGSVQIPKAEQVLLREQCAPRIGPVLFHALIKGESGWNRYAININKCTARFNGNPETKASAVDLVERLLKKYPGISIDIGPGQLNSKNLPKLGLTVEDAMDTCTNLRAAETVLVDWCFLPAVRRYGWGEKAVNAAISCYNTGGYTRGLENGYVGHVYRLALRSGKP